MKNFLNKQREIISLLVYAIGVAGLIYGVILPLLSGINRINDQIQQEIMSKESIKLHIEELPKIQKQYETLQSSGDLSDVLLDRNKAVVLIEKLEKLAENTNCKITISIQENSQSAPAKKSSAKSDAVDANSLVGNLPSPDFLQLKISLTGDYNSVLKFVSHLEKFQYYTDIVSIQINKAGVSQSSANEGVFGSSKVVPMNGLKEGAPDVIGDKVNASLLTVFYTN